MRIILFILFFFSFVTLNAQFSASDYYKTQINFSNSDTLGLYTKIFKNYKTNNYTEIAQADYRIIQGKINEALIKYSNVLAEVKQQKSDSLAALVNFKIGYLYYTIDNYPIALQYLNNASLFINYQPENSIQAKVYIFSGLIHYTLGSLVESEKCFNTAIIYFRKNKNYDRVVATQNNIAILYMENKKYKEARIYFDSCLFYRRNKKDNYGIGQTLNNIGTLLYLQEKYSEALKSFQEGYEFRLIGDVPPAGIIESKVNIGKTFLKLKNYQVAKKWLEEGMAQARDIGHYELQKRTAQELMELYFILGDYKNAYLNQTLFYISKDSLYGYEKKAVVNKLAIENQFKSKIQKDSIQTLEKSKADKIIAEEKEKWNNLIFVVLGIGMVFLLFFVLQLYKTNLNRKKANSIILAQKNSLDEKQKEIVDSINYAKRIQNAILPSKRIINNHLKDSFIFYLPKDIVAGDFYWIEKKNSKILFAAADCTGHGVPGALVSVICHGALNRAVREYNLDQPALILNKTREIVIQEFEKSEDVVQDGMDIAICSLDLENNILEYAGANNPLWIIRDNSLIELKPDKQPIGKYEHLRNFSNHIINVQKNDLIVIFTDGFADQFGGEKGKKFKYSNFQQLVIDNSNMDLNHIAQFLNAKFEEWKGDLEQIDDICIIGVRI